MFIMKLGRKGSCHVYVSQFIIRLAPHFAGRFGQRDLRLAANAIPSQ